MIFLLSRSSTIGGSREINIAYAYVFLSVFYQIIMIIKEPLHIRYDGSAETYQLAGFLSY